VEVTGQRGLLVHVSSNGETLQNHTGLTNPPRLADEVGGCDRSSLMDRPTTESEAVTSFRESSQQLQTQVSDCSFRSGFAISVACRSMRAGTSSSRTT
jgi:hypothetical protein